MTKMSMFMLAGLLLLSQAAIANQEFESKCAQWAVEDDIPEAEKASYIQNCVSNLIEEQAQGGEGEQPKD